MSDSDWTAMGKPKPWPDGIPPVFDPDDVAGFDRVIDFALQEQCRARDDQPGYVLMADDRADRLSAVLRRRFRTDWGRIIRDQDPAT